MGWAVTCLAMTALGPKFAKRLKEAMLKAGYEAKPGVLVDLFNLNHAEGTGVAFMTASRWLKGTIPDDLGKVQTLARVLEVDPGDLLFGRERLGVGEAQSAWNASSASDRAMFDTFLSLPAPKRKLVRELVAALAAPE